MVFVQSTFRVTRFARDLPLSVGGELGEGGSLTYPIPGIAPGGSGYVNVGIPGTGGPFDIYPFPGQPYPGVPGAGVNPQIVKVSIPRPVNPGQAITIYMWFAASYGPRQYAMRTEIPEIGYNHTTPYIFASGPGVYQLQNAFTIPADIPVGEIQGTLKLLTNEQGTTNITIADDEPFVLIVQTGEPGEPPTTQCPPGAELVNEVCVCTDPTKEIWQNLCVQKCPEGYTRDAQTGVCELNTCPEGQHRNDQGVCVPDIVPCPEGQHRNDAGVCVPDTVECPAGQHEENGVCVPDPVPTPTIPPFCEGIDNPILKQICIQIAGSSCATEDTDEAEDAEDFCESMSNESCRHLCKRIFRVRDDYPHPEPEPHPTPPRACSDEWIERLCSRYDDNPRAYSRCKQILNYQCKRGRTRSKCDRDRCRRKFGGKCTKECRNGNSRECIECRETCCDDRGHGNYGGSGGGGSNVYARAGGGGTYATAGGGSATATAGGVTAQAGLARSYHPYWGYGRWSY